MTMMQQRLLALSLTLVLQSSLAFIATSPSRINSAFLSSRTTRCFAEADDSEEASGEPLMNNPDEVSQFEKDLLDAFGTEDQDDALTNAAFSAFARDLQNVDEIDDWGEWNADTSDDDFLISEEEAFELYTETMNDMAMAKEGKEGEVDLDQFSADVPDDEKQLVEDMVASANKAIESIWGEEGMTNPVKAYFKGVEEAKEGEDAGSTEEDKA